MGRKLIRLNVKYDGNTLIKTSFFDYEWDRCTGASACCLERAKNEKSAPWDEIPLLCKRLDLLQLNKAPILVVSEALSRPGIFLLFRRVYSAILSYTLPGVFLFADY